MPSDFIPMTSKFRGRCKACGKPIAKGSAIGYSRALGARHANGKCCPVKPEDVLAAAAARPADDTRRRYEPDATDLAYEDECARRCGI